MSEYFSLLAPMSDRPYAIGERPGPSQLRPVPLLSGKEAWESLAGLRMGRLAKSAGIGQIVRGMGRAVSGIKPALGRAFPTVAKDPSAFALPAAATAAVGSSAALVPHMIRQDQAKDNLPYMEIKQPEPQRAPSGEVPTAVPQSQPPTTNSFRDNLARYGLPVGAGALGALGLYHLLSQPEEDEKLAAEHPFVAGFMQGCRRSGRFYTRDDIKNLVRDASAIDPIIKEAFVKAGYGDIAAGAPGTAGGPKPAAGPAIPPPTQPKPLSVGAAKPPVPAAPAPQPAPQPSSDKAMWFLNRGYHQSLIDEGEYQRGLSKFDKVQQAVGDPKQWITGVGPAGAANVAKGMSAAPAASSGLTNTIAGTGMQLNLGNKLQPNPGLHARLLQGRGGGEVGPPPLSKLPSQFGTPAARQSLYLPGGKADPPLGFFGNAANNIAGMVGLGRKPSPAHTIHEYNAAIEQGLEPSPQMYAAAMDALPQSMAANKPPEVQPAADSPAAVAHPASPTGLVENHPDVHKQLAQDVKTQLTKDPQAVGAAMDQIQSPDPNTPADQTALGNLTKQLGGHAEKALQAYQSMGPGEKLLLYMGLGLGAIGLISSMGGKGGAMGWLTALLGLGGAAGAAAHGGMLGETAQGFTKDMVGKAQGLFGGGENKPPAGGASNPAAAASTSNPLADPAQRSKLMAMPDKQLLEHIQQAVTTDPGLDSQLRTIATNADGWVSGGYVDKVLTAPAGTEVWTPNGKQQGVGLSPREAARLKEISKQYARTAPTG